MEPVYASTEPRTTDLSEYAAVYAALGFIPIPVRPNEKIPSLLRWQNQTPGVQEAMARFSGHQGNIGVTFPDDLFALDVDMPDGPASLRKLIDQYGELPPTLTQETPSGGRHLVFRKPPAVRLKNTSRALGKGLDIRATGGQIVVEPSTINGNSYGWLDWEVLGDEKPEIAEAPQWLLTLLGDAAPTRTDTTPTQTSAGDQQGKLIHEGERNTHLFKIACAMQGHGNCETAILAQLQHVNEKRCTPPLPDDEIQTIVNSATKYLKEKEKLEDPLENLCEKARKDSGAPFEPGVIDAILRMLKKPGGQAEFERLRSNLKSTGCRVTELDKIINHKLGVGKEKTQIEILEGIVKGHERKGTLEAFRPTNESDASYVNVIFISDEIDEITGSNVQYRKTFGAPSHTLNLWLTNEFFKSTGKAPNADTLKAVMNRLEAKAKDKPPRYSIFLRVGHFKEKFYIDCPSTLVPNYAL